MNFLQCLSNCPVLIAVVFIATLSSCTLEQTTRIQSPDDRVRLEFSLSDEGTPRYIVTHSGETVIDTSSLGFEFKNQPGLRNGLEIVRTRTRTRNNTWQPVWGQRNEIDNHYRELLVELREQPEPGRTLHIRFRVYNDGIGFRFEFPDQTAMDSVNIMREYTRFNLPGDHTAWWIPADYDSYEYVYETTKVSEIDASNYREQNKRPDRQIANFSAVNTPVALETGSGLYLSLHEADLTDYAGMTLAVRVNHDLESELVPWADGVKVKTSVPFVTPWRTVQIGESPGDLIESNLIVNLNDPSVLDDTSWIEPMKYTGIWWEMHVGKSSWNIGELAEGSYGEIGAESNHGATTDNAKRYIDFTSGAGLRGMLVEGWNTGWEFWGTDTVGFFDFTTPYPDFDLEEAADYARDNDVALIGHHETSGQAAHYETRLDTAFALYRSLGIHAVKTGYAGAIVPEGEYHHGQYMVRHHQKVAEIAARYQIMVNAHEPVKPTGKRRTYPNFMTREGVRGMEYNAWSEGNPPEHTTILPFTRVLGGPVDYTPGIFDIEFDEYRDREQVHSTLANQLALYVVLYSPMQMAADLPQNYKTDDQFHPAFRFIRDVGVDWDHTRVLDAAIGDYLTVARKQRGTENWFVGSVTDEEARDVTVDLGFLNSGTTYEATIYRDGENAGWDTNPTSYEIETREVDNSTLLNLHLAPGGGAAISLEPGM